jgi:glucosyl-3-phosphoglycerate synthase
MSDTSRHFSKRQGDMPHNFTAFQRVLVPVLEGCDPANVLALAQHIAAGRRINLLGIVRVKEGESLSVGAISARKMRERLRDLAAQASARYRPRVHVSHTPWQEILNAIQSTRSNLLILDWPCCLDSLGVPAETILAHPPSNIALVRGPVHEDIGSILVPMRGGPYAEVALRFALAAASSPETKVTSLHLTPSSAVTRPEGHSDAPFKGLARVLERLSDIDRREMETSNPAESIVTTSREFDLVVMGAGAHQPQTKISLGHVAETVLRDSPATVVIIKTRQPMPAEPEGELIGGAAISILVDRWFAEQTYHADEFADLEHLLALKHKQNLTISLAMPALNEEETIGNVIETVQNALVRDAPLLDEIILMDSNSIDRTRTIAESMGIPIFIHQDTLPQYGARRGKGEALWKSLFATRGDIIIWIDTDIVNIHPRFVYGLLGPLLLRPKTQFVKGFYRRPLRVGGEMQEGGGGRVTELTARPLLNLFYPELSGIIQPLSGEYGGRRKALEQMAFFSGYGVEIGLLIDIFETFGLSAIAQVDLLERVHHNQPLEALGKMSFAIIQAVIRKLERRYGQAILEDINRTMKLIRYADETFFLDIEEIAERERPPMMNVPEYLAAHHREKSSAERVGS